ncbi:prephenate dehydrogenase [Candidatus Endomicrobiellum devescovinae]|jgi:prephenate dehydrogenase|uniref:prephenate dehydrogenase n=1 Tax=Candidatus Endomicrobiellum devescovinae TaxID=3242322 RepID=UPI00282A2B6A|nr:prephenate dehydrogenase/arogenate dehydrogenase family protein [Endomicrobium sp.]
MLNVSIVGLGQIGGSLGLALKSKTLKNRYYVTGIARNKETLKAALKIGAADEVSLSLASAKNSDIVVICTPVDTIASIYKKLVKIVKKNTVITDSGSVKYSIEREINGINSKVSFIGSHPMAGRAKNGFSSASADMFKNAKVIITQQYGKPEKIVSKIWKDAGAEIVKMSAKNHDELVAFTSHLPHVIAFLLNKTYKKIKKKNPHIDDLIAGSFKSITRVSVSSADMWAPIFALNSKNINKYLDEFIKELNVFKRNLNDKKKIKKEILKTQKG